MIALLATWRGLIKGDTAGQTRWVDGRDAGQGTSGCRHIAREMSKSVYSWGIDRKGKTEEIGIEDKEE